MRLSGDNIGIIVTTTYCVRWARVWLNISDCQCANI